MGRVRLKTAPVVPWGVALPWDSMLLQVVRRVFDAFYEAGMDIPRLLHPLQKIAHRHELG